MSTAVKIAIVGLGPRGLAVVERVTAHARRAAHVDIELLLFDPGIPGPGCHSIDQSDVLLMNTLAAQVTQFPPFSEGDSAERLRGPDFDEWAADSAWAHDSGTSSEAREHFFPRAVFGRYLHDAYLRIRAAAPSNVRVTHVAREVTDARRQNNRWTVFAEQDSFDNIDYLHIATGHGVGRNHAPSDGEPVPAITHAEHIAMLCAAVGAHETVAVEGLGLVAHDVIALLTIGRGGRFEQDGRSGALRYIRSGREPRIVAYSRTGLPLMARPVSHKKLTSDPPATYFTSDVPRALRRREPVDFESQVLPLIIQEMQAAYDRSVSLGEAAEKADRTDSDQPESPRAPTAGAPPFSWQALVNPIPREALTSRANFARFLLGYLRADVREASIGNVASPIKAACDVLREMRERIAEIVDFDGLSGDSHRRFYEQFLPILKRLSVGPPKERTQQMVALIESGILTMDFGPGATSEPVGDTWLVRSTVWTDYSCTADHLIRARLGRAAEATPPLIASLVRQGYAQFHDRGGYRAGGIVVAPDMTVISRDGTPTENLWATGVATEGSRFYTTVLGRPGAPSRWEQDAESAVATIFASIRPEAPVLRSTASMV